MPGAFEERHILNDLAVTTNQQMTGYLQVRYFGKIGMRTGLKIIGKELIDFRATVHSRGQTDTMNDDERYLATVGTFIKVGGCHLAGIQQPVSGRIKFHAFIIQQLR